MTATTSSPRSTRERRRHGAVDAPAHRDERAPRCSARAAIAPSRSGAAERPVQRVGGELERVQALGGEPAEQLGELRGVDAGGVEHRRALDALDRRARRRRVERGAALAVEARIARHGRRRPRPRSGPGRRMRRRRRRRCAAAPASRPRPRGAFRWSSSAESCKRASRGVVRLGPQLAAAAWELNLLLQARVPPGTDHGPSLSGAPIPLVLAQRMRRLANKLEPLSTLAPAAACGGCWRALDRAVRPAPAGAQARAPAAAARSTGAGAPVSRSDPLAVFGKAITSRIESRPASSATIRSRPNAIPPSGGAP